MSEHLCTGTMCPICTDDLVGTIERLRAENSELRSNLNLTAEETARLQALCLEQERWGTKANQELGEALKLSETRGVELVDQADLLRLLLREAREIIITMKGKNPISTEQVTTLAKIDAALGEKEE